MSSFPFIRPRPVRALYTIFVFLGFLFIMAFVWLVLYAVIAPIRLGIVGAMNQYNVANTTYQNWELAEAFMANLWEYILVICVIGVLYWVWIYSQRRAADRMEIYA